MIYSITLSVTVIIYVVILFKMKKAWERTPDSETENLDLPVTIIIVFRNEEDNIINLLNDLYRQEYDTRLMEVLLINDDSDDESVELIANWKKHHDLHVDVYDLHARSKAFKKEGIELGIAHASHDNILLTDADCRLSERWVQSMTITDFRQLRCGPVCFIPQESFWSAPLELEMISLSAMSASTIRMRKPLLSNGANMAYSRKLFFHTGGFEEDKEKDFPSGDDISLMKKIDQIDDSYIRYVKSPDAIVHTAMPSSFSEFINQRIRWAGKTRFDLFSKGSDIPFLLMLCYLMMFITPFVLIFSFDWLILISWLVAMVVKWIADRSYFLPVLNFFGRPDLHRYIYRAELIHLIYVVPMAIISLFMPFYWKGRRLTHG